MGVGLAVRERAPLPSPADEGWRPARLSEALPPQRLTDAGLATELQRVQQIEAALRAYQLALVAEFADRRPASADPRCRPSEVESEHQAPALEEISGVSEFFPDELAQVLSCSRTAATVLVEQAEALTGPLRRTGAALADGEIDWPRARVIADRLRVPLPETDPAVTAAVQDAVLPAASGLSVSALGALVDPGAAGPRPRRRRRPPRPGSATTDRRHPPESTVGRCRRPARAGRHRPRRTHRRHVGHRPRLRPAPPRGR